MVVMMMVLVMLMLVLCRCWSAGGGSGGGGGGGSGYLVMTLLMMIMMMLMMVAMSSWATGSATCYNRAAESAVWPGECCCELADPQILPKEPRMPGQNDTSVVVHIGDISILYSVPLLHDNPMIFMSSSQGCQATRAKIEETTQTLFLLILGGCGNLKKGFDYCDYLDLLIKSALGL